MFHLGLKNAAVSHVCSVLVEACCVTCFAWSRRRLLCHMFRLQSKKHVVSHVSLGAEEGVTIMMMMKKKMMMKLFVAVSAL